MKMAFSICLAIFAGGIAALPAQTAAKASAPVRASVGEVTDNRTTGSFNSECKVELRFTGDAAADAQSIRRVQLTKVLDELDRDLIPTGDPNSQGFSSFSSDRRNPVLKTELRLRNPSRNAAAIRIIEGQVEFFYPTPANGGVVIVKDILKHPAEAAQNPTLKKFGIELIYFTKESYEAKKKQLQEQQKNDPSGAVGNAFGDLFNGMFGGMMSSNSKNNVMLYVKDPEKRVIDFEYQDATGKTLKHRSSWSSNEMHSQDFDNAPPPDTQLLIHLATPEALQIVPFKIENIPLP